MIIFDNESRQFSVIEDQREYGDKARWTAAGIAGAGSYAVNKDIVGALGSAYLAQRATKIAGNKYQIYRDKGLSHKDATKKALKDSHKNLLKYEALGAGITTARNVILSKKKDRNKVIASTLLAYGKDALAEHSGALAGSAIRIRTKSKKYK